ncbi:acyl-CoA N-acyltransferase [Daldinia sp. FL1419]|nr:acyl-CoA N-acyltransferase [Daldinia sp. FL1419]
MGTSNENLQFRVATLDNAAQIQQLVQSAFRAEDSRENWTGDMALASRFSIKVEEIASNIAKPDSAFLMAIDENGSLIGSVCVSKRSTGLGRISMLAVDPRRHRGGLGRKILSNAEEYCQRAWGVGRIGLNALSSRHELIAWYMRRGYQKTGGLTQFPREWFAGLTLPDDLCFVELEKDLDTAHGIAETV